MSFCWFGHEAVQNASSSSLNTQHIYISSHFLTFPIVSYEMTMSVRFCLPYDRFKLDFIVFKVDNTHKVVTDVVMTLHVRAKMLCNVWS